MSTAQAGYQTTRRGFLASAAGIVAGVAIAPAARLLASAPPAAPVGSRVVKTVSHRAIDGLQVRVSRLRKMIDECLRRLAEESRITDAWARYARPGKRLLLKLTRLPGAGLQTEQAMLVALLDSLTSAGHRPSDITVAGCDTARRIKGLRPTPPGWSSRLLRWGDEAEQVRRYLDDVDVVINVPSITDHCLTGVACALVNVSLPLIRHPARYYRDVHQTVAAICADADTLIRPSLTVVNALRCVYEGGPIVHCDNVGYQNGVWASTDPVAIDRLAAEWVQRQRQRHHLVSLAADKRPATYIDLAGARHLGVSDPRRILVDTHRM